MAYRNTFTPSSQLPTNAPFRPQKGRAEPTTAIGKAVQQNLARKHSLRRRTTLQVKESLEKEPIEVGSEVWIPDSEDVWVATTILEQIDDIHIKGKTAKGKDEILDLRNLNDNMYKLNPRTVEDMTSLYYIHEAGILHNLRERSNDGKPYTYMANVLIAVNPLRPLLEPKVTEYTRAQQGDKPPHPYAVAETAFQQMCLWEPAQSQSIVISGESGAGKTETSKIVLRFLTIREHALSSGASGEDTQAELDRRLLDSNPILESFGNAKTLRNNNSSRFGKFMKLQFSPDSTHSLVGASIETYLLEKSRLVHQIQGERNFHIFYQLLSGAEDSMKMKYNITSPQDFAYLNQSGCVTAEDMDDELWWEDTTSALRSVLIGNDVQEVLFGILAGLLHLGNVTMVNEETREGNVAKVTDLKSLGHAARLLGLVPEGLRDVICQRVITARGETFVVKRDAQSATYARDGIAKSIYNGLFLWIVNMINVSLGQGPAELPFIGVLDIFGFESFERNDFEQLLINYANEALQATFNQQVFIAEQDLYKAEGLEVGRIIWPDNRECIDLISRKPDGILPLLDQEMMTPKPQDEKWNVILHKAHEKHPHFIAPHPKDKKFQFIVKHFATKVTYTIGNFIDKNDDTIPKDLEELLLSSNLPLVKDILAVARGDKDIVPNKSTPQRRGLSVSGKFSQQMLDLVNTLDSTRCNFIRCIKPNAFMKPGVFDNWYVVDQLRCTGMLATCELLKVGLPTRISYGEICRIYKPVLPPQVEKMFAQYTDRTFTEAVLWAFRVESDAYRLGRTKVFFKTGKIALLDALLKVDMKKMGPWIVGRLKKWLARRRWRYATAKIMGQHAFLWLLKLVNRKKNAVVKVQSFMRMVKARKEYLSKRQVARISARKAAAARKQWRIVHLKFVAAQKFLADWQQIHARLEQERAAAEKAAILENRSALSIQSVYRGHVARVDYREAKAAAAAAAERARIVAERAREAASKAALGRVRWQILFRKYGASVVFSESYSKIHEALVAEAAAEAARKAALEAEAARKQRELENASATKIQATFRGFRGREEAARHAAIASAQAAALAASLAAAEAAQAAKEAGEAHLAEADALNRYQELKRQAELREQEELARSLAAQAAAEQPAEALAEPDMSWLNKTDESEVPKDYTPEVAEAPVEQEEPRPVLMHADEEAAATAVQTLYEFPTGPPIPYKGGIFTCTMLGHRKQQDDSWGVEYTEYVLRCTWGRDVIDKSKTAWLVGGRYNDFNALHQELKTAASGQRGKRPPWFPRFPKRHPVSSAFGKNQEEKFIVRREKELNRYMKSVLTQMPDALFNLHMDRFLNLNLRVQDIMEREAYAEARKKWEAEELEAISSAKNAQPLNEVELQEVEKLVHQLLERIIYSQGDIQRDAELQEMIHAVKILQPRVTASAQIGAGVNMELVPLAMQLQDDIQDAFNQYNDALLALKLGHDINT